jgi:hypothetical protein
MVLIRPSVLAMSMLSATVLMANAAVRSRMRGDATVVGGVLNNTINQLYAYYEPQNGYFGNSNNNPSCGNGMF